MHEAHLDGNEREAVECLAGQTAAHLRADLIGIVHVERNALQGQLLIPCEETGALAQPIALVWKYASDGVRVRPIPANSRRPSPDTKLQVNTYNVFVKQALLVGFSPRLDY